MLSGTKANIAIKLFGDDLNRMFTLGNEIKGAIQDIPGIADLNVEQQIERPQLIISPKREMLAKFGISLPEFSEFVNVCLAGETVSQVYEKGKSFDLTVRVRDDLRDEMEKIRNLMIDTSDGKENTFELHRRSAFCHGTEYDQPREREAKNRNLCQCCRPRPAQCSE